MGRIYNCEISKDIKVLGYKLAYLASFIVLKIVFFAVNNRPITDPYDFTSALDKIIPFNKIFVLPYVYWYFYVAFGFLFFAMFDYKKYFKLLGAILIGDAISIVIYIFVPSTIQRPIVFGNDVFSNMVNALYKNDSHFNCLPSQHILETVLISIFLIQFSKKYKMQIFVFLSTIAISLSTMFMKQHAALDVFVSFLLAFAVYYFITSDKIFGNKKVKRIIRYIIPDTVRHNFGYFRNKEKKDE